MFDGIITSHDGHQFALVTLDLPFRNSAVLFLMSFEWLSPSGGLAHIYPPTMVAMMGK